jgi:hypothetical protein
MAYNVRKALPNRSSLRKFACGSHLSLHSAIWKIEKMGINEIKKFDATGHRHLIVDTWFDDIERISEYTPSNSNKRDFGAMNNNRVSILSGLDQGA